ncbi:MAG: cytochrome-c peroxidase, partial [Flavobacteriales bacterium]|nr:cytochrome-c peroxidase [Flavobacteriales bacterium]
MNLQKHISVIVGGVFILAASGCQTDEPVPYQLDIPSWFPEMEIPAENQLTKARIELGRKLFYEPLLSLDSSVSCGTCHLQEKAFTDGLSISIGVDDAVGLRNAPTLANIGFAPYFFHDGGVLTLELQSQQPIFSVDEMRFSIAGFLERIKKDAAYKRMFEEAYNREPDAFGISRAIASFERTFISSSSRFDQFEYQGITDALSDQEKRGRTLFFSEQTKCSNCHQPPLFTNYEFENIGLYLNYADSGRARISHLATDNGKFKVPTLRNVELTAPYMHNGSMQ